MIRQSQRDHASTTTSFPGVGQVRHTPNRRGQLRQATQRDRLASPACPHRAHQRLLSGRTIEATHHILDWSFDEDRSRIRTGHGPENMTRLRRFAIGLIKARGLAVAETMRRLSRNPRRVLDFLKMTASRAGRARLSGCLQANYRGPPLSGPSNRLSGNCNP